MKEMTQAEHAALHTKMHMVLDSLVAHYITSTKKLLTESSILDLINWSFLQTEEPDHNHDD